MDSDIDLEKVCRLCFREDDGPSKMTSIYEHDLEETIRKCVQIEVLIGSNEPTNICSRCMLSLNSWSKFKELCDSTNTYIQQYAQTKNESDLLLNSEITNLGSLGFTPSHMSDLSISFFESDSLWNSFVAQQWNDVDQDVDPTCTDLPTPKYMKKVQPSEDFTFDTMSGEECINMALNILSSQNDNLNFNKAHWWNPKSIYMKTVPKENKKPSMGKEMSKLKRKFYRTDVKTYCCNVCLETFTKFHDLIVHDSTVHISIPKNFSCETCGKLFLSKDRLEVHRRAHREKLFVCTFCQKKFALQKTLDNHLNVHIGQYVCQKCGYKAPTMHGLKVHENTHSLVKDHSCEECDKCFSTMSSLRRHKRLVHQKLDLFRCDQCDYSTVQPSNLKYHKSTHTPEIFICHLCGMDFKNQHSFQAHLKCHKDANLSCIHCGKQFLKKLSLREHLTSAHGMGPSNKKHKCDVCQKFFSRMRNLRQHKNKYHQT